MTLVRGLEVAHVLRDFDEPRYTAGAPDGRHAFVSDSGRRDVAVVDLVRGVVVTRLRLDAWPQHLSLDESGRVLWVSLGNEAERIAVVDVTRPTEPRLERRIRPPFLAHDVGFVPGTRHVWVTSGDRGALAIYDAPNGHLFRRLPAGSPPQHVTFRGGNAYVTSGDDGTLHVQSLEDGRVLVSTTIPLASYNVQAGGARILTPSLERGTLSVLDSRGRVLHSIQASRSSHDACFI